MKSRIGIGLIILLCLLSFQYWIALENQKELPSERWSRAFTSNIEPGPYSKLQSVPEDDGFTISVYDFDKLLVLSCDEDLDCKNTRTIDDLNTYKNSWSDNNHSYYIKDTQLIHWTDSKERVIAQNVEDFIKTQDSFIYWTTDGDVITLAQSLNVMNRKHVDQPIYFTKVIGDQLFVMTEKKNESRYTITNLTDTPTDLFSFQINATESLTSADILLNTDQQFVLLLEKGSISGGGRGKAIQTVAFDLTQNQKPTFSNVSFIDNASKTTISDIRFPSIHTVGSEQKILFSGNMRNEFGETVNNVFLGDFDTKTKTISADAVTKNDLYIRPVLLNEQTVAFYKVEGKNRLLGFASSEEGKKQVSMDVMKGDYKATFYTLLTILFNGFVLLLLSFCYIVPALCITYGTQFILKKKKGLYSYRNLLILHLFVTLVFQLLLIYRFIQIENLILMTPFLSSNLQFILLLVGAIVVSSLPLWFRYKITEDNFNSSIIYVTLLNLAILFVLIGPFMV